MTIDIPLPLWERLRERASRDKRPLKWQAVYLIEYALEQLEREDARRQVAGPGAAGEETTPAIGGEHGRD